MSEHLAKEFEEYRSQALPTDLTEDEIRVFEMSFHAGVLAVMSRLGDFMRARDADGVAAFLREVDAELRAFTDQMAKS